MLINYILAQVKEAHENIVIHIGYTFWSVCVPRGRVSNRGQIKSQDLLELELQAVGSLQHGHSAWNLGPLDEIPHKYFSKETLFLFVAHKEVVI